MKRAKAQLPMLVRSPALDPATSDYRARVAVSRVDGSGGEACGGGAIRIRFAIPTVPTRSRSSIPAFSPMSQKMVLDKMV